FWQLLLRSGAEPSHVAYLALEQLLFVAPRVRREELALLLELVTEPVEVVLLVIPLLLHARLVLLELLAGLHARLRLGEDALEIYVAHARGRRALPLHAAP